MAGIVIALGGNALGETVSEQRRIIESVAVTIVDIAQSGAPLVITHGNGPQVGMISAAMDSAQKNGIISERMPLAECVAMSQGYIGYHIQSAINGELKRRNLNIATASLVTQILVDENDSAFSRPTKPVGSRYTRADAEDIIRTTGYVFREDAGRGWRRVVSSPSPQNVAERGAIRAMFESGIITICGGGGGIPVVRRGCRLESVDAVIDKDFAAAKLARIIGADKLLILTGAAGVYLNYNTPSARIIESMTVKEADVYCASGCFAEGSMLPKILAAVSFAQTGGTAIITSIDDARRALDGKGGTRILPEDAYEYSCRRPVENKCLLAGSTAL